MGSLVLCQRDRSLFLKSISACMFLGRSCFLSERGKVVEFSLMDLVISAVILYSRVDLLLAVGFLINL